MGLPSPQQMQELSRHIGEFGGQCYGKWPYFQNIMKKLTQTAAPSVVKGGVAKGLHLATGIHKGLPAGTGAGTFGGPLLAGAVSSPISTALKPWISAATVAVQAGKVFKLYDLLDDVRRPGTSSVRYACHCGNCAGNIRYVIDKKERNTAIVAVSAFTFGTVSLGKKLHSIGKWAGSKLAKEERPKVKVCKGLVESARGGCTAAMGAIFLLSGSWTFMGNRDEKTMSAAVATIVSEDGWEKLKGNW